MTIHRWKRTAALLPLLALLAAVLPLRPGLVRAADTPNPTSVTIAGSFQQELGCSSDWQPPCDTTKLTYDATDDVWQAQFALPASPADAGRWEYKAALNNAWDENYGAGAQRGGANIGLALNAPTSVKFLYDHKTHWATDNVTSQIATVAGSFQSEIGCPGDWQPDCLRSWMQDPDGNGVYTFSTTNIPPGSYEFKVALNEQWNESYPGSNVAFTVSAPGEKVTINWNATTKEVTFGDNAGNIELAKAHWVSRDTIAWNIDPTVAKSYKLHYDPTGALTLTKDGVQGGQALTLTADPAGLSSAIKARFPHLASYAALKLNPADLAKVPTILKGQIAVSAADSAGNLLDATSLQLPGVLDDLYTYNGALGVVWQKNNANLVPALKLWAPTARSVKLHLFNDAGPATPSTVYPMTGDPNTGVWSIAGQPNWNGKYYLYEVEVFVRATGKIERNLVTDPYSISLAINSTRSQIVNLDDPALKPAGWDKLKKPELAAPEDMVLYELQVRDFSIYDQTVPEPYRGTYKAFTVKNSNGMKHLRALAKAGLTTIHMLPVFDIATINEDKAQRKEPDPNVLASFPPNSTEQRDYLKQFQETDGFNWGYDPYHYTTPEGSYATDPNGTTRIREFREMVQSLSDSGLRMVMDVVYNHTNASGQDPKSVLDKIVPGYYQRLNAEGNVETSTCCQNTATENNMMEKLMIDSAVTWARDYKVDGFRFDLMGHHMQRNMIKLRDTLRALTPAKDGVDGSKIYIYGEGWNFGEVANNARGVNATQLNMAGTGIGTFSDRLRDAVRGGGPFDSGTALVANQGFINGLFYDPNAQNQGDADEEQRLLLYADQIRVGMAGNLRDYSFTDRTGKLVKGSEVDYNGSPTGYTLDPQEVITYIEAHDNQTLWDNNQYKLPLDTPMADRVRAQNVGNSIVMLGQGIPFFQAGQDMLRSKSLDRNSYNSGDWFNRLDFSYETNNWGVGLPPSENAADEPIQKELLGNPALKPTKPDILQAVNQFRELLLIRKSSPLFRLQTGADVQNRVRYWNTGPNQQRGLLVYSIDDTTGRDLDPRLDQIVVLINANDQAQTFTAAELKGKNLMLHPVQAAGSDPVVKTSVFAAASGTFTIPARTVAVFVLPQARR